MSIGISIGLLVIMLVRTKGKAMLRALDDGN